MNRMTTESDVESDTEDLDLLLDDFKRQIQDIHALIPALDTQIKALYSRAKHETVSWMTEPLVPSVQAKAWCSEHGLGDRPTIQEFLEAVFKAALTMDYETRILTFKKKDADTLWKGQQSITLFDIIGAIPTLFL